MPHFLLRVVLYQDKATGKEPQPEDFLALHEALLSQKFYRTVQGAGDRWWQLPDSEYAWHGDATVLALRSVVRELCKTVWPNFTLFVKQDAPGDAPIAWFNLQPAPPELLRLEGRIA